MLSRSARIGVAICLLFCVVLLLLISLNGLRENANAPVIQEDERYPLGEGSLKMVRASMREPVANLSGAEKLEFYTGHSFAKNPWVVAPASTTARDGLGPLYSARSCMACHVNGGKGKVFKPGDDLESLVVKISLPSGESSETKQVMGVYPEPTYGDQLQIRGLDSYDVPAEASYSVSWEATEGHYDDGTSYQLNSPILQVGEWGYGELDSETLFSLRLAPALAGMGFIEAIPEQAILDQADPNDKDGDGISGRPNWVWSVKSTDTVLGRFGWKASQPSVKQQTASALRNDMGITSRLFPQETCTEMQVACLGLPNGNGTGTGAQTNGTEVEDKLLDAISLFTSSIALPVRTDSNAPEVKEGREIFYETGCHLCHQPDFQTGLDTVVEAFSGQTIWPYSDFLLHDMGEALADGRSDFEASGSEWRTAPLWGLSTIKNINPHASYLHDGRAATLEEAILWHGGEAEAAKLHFVGLSAAERTQLIGFLESL